MTDADGPIWITEAETVSLIDLGESITSTQRIFDAQATGAATNLPKTQSKVGSATIHATGGAHGSDSFVGVKSWVHTSGGATPMLLLWSLVDGALLAVIEAHALGQYRTAAVSAVATSALAADDATTMAILGTGSQALIQVAAVNAVRPLERLTIWSPREQSRNEMVTRVENALQIKCTAVETPAEAVADAEIITLITRASEPFLTDAMPRRGAHINALGAIGLDRAEFTPELLGRCATVAVDDLPTARAASVELRARYGSEPDGAGWSQVRTLAEVVASGVPRPPESDLSLFKAMGTGVADLGIAQFVFEQAVENGLGSPLPRPARSRPRLRSSINRVGVGYV